jgi:flavin-dependent dehydrogenase
MPRTSDSCDLLIVGASFAGLVAARTAAMRGLSVGDAAGMVSPATGGGIRLAFQFGRRAAQAIADHLLHLGRRRRPRSRANCRASG